MIQVRTILCRMGALQHDMLGQTSLTELAVFSPGHFDINNTDAAFQPSFTHFGVDYASARYAYDDLTLTRTTRLPWEITSITRVQDQMSTSNLLASETLGLGGLDSVRGYDERTASGSLGMLATEEFRSPVFEPSAWLPGPAFGDALQFDAFWDFGQVRDNRVPAGAPGGSTLMSVGGGFRYTLNRFIDFRFENGWQLRNAPGARGVFKALSNMLVQDPAAAQIQLVLVSNDPAQSRQLLHDLKASKFVYFLQAFDNRDHLADFVRRHIDKTGSKTPTVLVIDFNFAGNDSETLLETARALSLHYAIECVVTAPPKDASKRSKLMSLGARLYDSDLEQASLETTLH